MPAAAAARSLGLELHLAAPPHHTWAPKNFDLRDLTDVGLIVHEIPMSRRGKNIFSEIRTILAIRKLCRELRPEVLHGLTIKPILYGGIIARLEGVPCFISSVTGLGKIFSAKGVAMELLRFLVVRGYSFAFGHRNSLVLLENPDDGKTLVQLGTCLPEKLHIINGTGAPTEVFSRSPEPDNEQPIIILAARLIWDKGIGEFAEAASLLKQQGVRCKMVLVGDTRPDNPDSVPVSQLKEWEQEGILEWWGRCEDMPEIFAKANIVCLPTKYGEGIPRSLIEAAACGRAIVTTDAPGCREIVKKGQNGLLVPLGDSAALAEALTTLIRDPELRQRMGEIGRKLVENHFSIEHVEQETFQAYSRLLQRAEVNPYEGQS